MKSRIAVLGCVIALHLCMPASAGLLDSIKKKADEAARSIRDAAQDVEAVTKVDERAEAEAQRAVGGVEAEVDAELDVEGRARAGVAATELGRSAADVEREARAAEYELDRTASSDERLARDARSRVDSTAADIERRTDVQAQAETAFGRSDAGVAATKAERDAVAAEREVDAAGRVVQDPAGAARRRAERETGGATRSLEGVGEAARELESALD